VIGMVIFFTYSHRNSRLRTGKPLTHDLEVALHENL